MLLFVSYTDFYVTIKCRFSKDNSTSNESAKGALGPRLGKLKRAEVGLNLRPQFRGTQRLFSVKYLFGEANIA